MEHLPDFILFNKINNLQHHQKLGDLTGFTTLSFHHCEVKTSQHYLDKYFTLTIIENGQLIHLYFKHANTVFTLTKALN